LSFIYNNGYSLNEKQSETLTKQLLQFHSKTTHMNQLNCIIIDDEEGAHRVLEHFISQLTT
jgi:hypothetical protein